MSALLVPGCLWGEKQAKVSIVAASATAEALVKILLDTDERTRLYRQHIQEAITQVKAELKKEADPGAPNLNKVAADWEGNWAKVSKEADEIRSRFKGVSAASNKYWDELGSVVSQIGDPKLRDSEEKKNRQAKVAWDKRYDAAKEKIAILDRLKDTGDDLHKVMVAAALRRQLADYTLTLEQIAKDAEALFVALTELTEQGQLIVGLLPNHGN